MPEKEPQFFGNKVEARGRESREDREKDERLGIRAEKEIAQPLFDELIREKIISGAWKTGKKVDSALGVDFVVELSGKKYVAIDVCTASHAAERWGDKVGEWGNNPLRTLGQVHPEHEKTYERFFGSHEGLSRAELLAIQKEREKLSPQERQELGRLKEKVPMLCLDLKREEVVRAFEKVDGGQAKTAVEGLYDKEAMKLRILKGIAAGLSQYLDNKEFINKYGLDKLRSGIVPKYQAAIESVDNFFQKLQKEPARLGHNDVERRVAVTKTSQFLEQHRAILKKQ